MRYVITILEDNVNTAKHIETIVINEQSIKFIEGDLMDSAREAIEEHEGFEFLHDNRISDIVDKINRKWDDKVHDLLVDTLNDLVLANVDLDEVDTTMFDDTACFDSVPGIDVGELEEQFKESRIRFTVEWKMRFRFGSMSTWSVSSEKSDYYVIFNELPCEPAEV